ncbi:TIGR02281 family clan AA aspartic protease [Thiohalocapsa marina]|uniref:TIGR02281 family clan AA aspartic protease n=1 Tax=Thiohalocapsa marina TaxID=424902 RepID=A0A5M8FP06_9GAMM|nr:TIGR02281 family clan AA aspartic protease [Thiohalocapsa marina]KAA6185406.1 TIGR02281 family clan AA aspartic protease [Thiohalocapsa marina]
MSGDLPSSDDLPSRFGKAMLLGAWVAGLALLVLLFGNLIEHRNNPNRDPALVFGADGLPQVMLLRNRMGHYVADGLINGERVTFMVDTGATAVALPMDLARRLQLPLRPGGMSKTANGLVQTWSTRLDSVSVGGLTARNVRAVVMPNMPGDEVLLGMSYLRRFEMIQRGGTLTLRVPG